MMIPIPRPGGIYHGVEGVERAMAVADIEDVTITATEGRCWFRCQGRAIWVSFSREETAEAVECTTAVACGTAFQIATALETFSPSS
jgi:hypothetical protein